VERGIDISSYLIGLRSIRVNNIDLSIIIVNYKSWGVLQQCLDSFKQFPPKLSHEIIVIDNDSQDGEFEVFAKHNLQIKLIKNSGNNGFSNGCSLGVDNSNGEFLLFLNPDIVLTNKSDIDEMVKFANNTDIGITSCRKINSKGSPEREITFSSPWLIIGWIRAIYKQLNKKQIALKYKESQNIWYPEWIAGSVILIKFTLFNKINNWDQGSYWMYYEDVDLCKRVATLGKKISLLRNIEFEHLHGGSSRRNPKTTAITKSEVVTSSHVFIHEHTRGLNRFALHLVIMVNTLASWLLRTILTLPFFWRGCFRENLFNLVSHIKYYLSAMIRQTWKSKRLKNNES
jgi:GT2 family glycosyltransferase